MSVPQHPKIYHIVHVDRLPSIIRDGRLWSDQIVIQNGAPGTTIGMGSIKQRRLTQNDLSSHPGLKVGACVPFYFCPRSVMLYLIYRANNSELNYRGGQGPIVHLEADLHQAVAWANANNQRWAFTLSNAGSSYFEDRSDLKHLNEIDWQAIKANNWQTCREGKQAEFLCESSFPWELIQRVGVATTRYYQSVMDALAASAHNPSVEIKGEWYY